MHMGTFLQQMLLRLFRRHPMRVHQPAHRHGGTSAAASLAMHIDAFPLCDTGVDELNSCY